MALAGTSIKVLWGSDWDPLLEKDTEGLLVKRLEEMLDGEAQKLSVESGAYVRQHVFGSDPRLLKHGREIFGRAASHAKLGGTIRGRFMPRTKPLSITAALRP